MGDNRRGKSFAKYIIKNHPKAKSVFAIADGNLNLARELCGKYKVTVIDPDIRNKNGNVRNLAKVIGKEFHSDWKVKCDLIVGMHPDEATGEIIDYALKNNVPCEIVPCCLVGKYADKCRIKGRWVKFIKNLLIQKGRKTFVRKLPIQGANQIISSKSRS